MSEVLTEFITSNHVHAPQAHNYSVRILHKGSPADWHAMPYALASVADFCQEHEREANVPQLIRAVQYAFILDDPGMIVVAFFLDGAFIGHMLCDRSLLYFQPIVTVHQYLLKCPIPAEIRDEAHRLVEEWGKKPSGDPPQSAVTIQFLVRSQALARMYRRFFGATTHRLIMRVPIKE